MSGRTVRAPTWDDFEELPATDFEPRPPAQELATVLCRFRAELDAAGRAGAASRMRALRALADQAVLAIELETLLERQRPASADASLERAHARLRALKDRMLAQVEASGLEVVRLQGAAGGDVADIVEIDHWHSDDLLESPVVVLEIEAAVRLDGTLLRRGRVVMGGLGEASPAQRPREVPSAGGEVAAPHAPDPRPQDRGAPPDVVCPVTGCGARNPALADVCVGCLTPLAGFARLSLYPAMLFNQGLRAARNGRRGVARECFAAGVIWAPDDLTVRNAHALACFDAGDLQAARRGWEEVLARAPGERLALRGLAELRAARVPADGPRSDA